MRAGTLQCKTADQAFITRSFQNWKDTTQLFCCYEQSSCHIETAERVLTRLAIAKHIGEMLSTQVAETRRINQANLLHVLSAVKFLARQGLPLHGSGLTQETDSNLSQLLCLLCKYDDQLPS